MDWLRLVGRPLALAGQELLSALLLSALVVVLPSLSARGGPLTRTGNGDAIDQRPAGDEQIAAHTVVAQLAVERETLRIDPERHRRLGRVEMVDQTAKFGAGR